MRARQTVLRYSVVGTIDLTACLQDAYRYTFRQCLCTRRPGFCHVLVLYVDRSCGISEPLHVHDIYIAAIMFRSCIIYLRAVPVGRSTSVLTCSKS